MESHALKGSSLSLGANGLGRIAEAMEGAARSSKAGGVGDLLQDIEAEFERVQTAIRARLSQAA